MTYLGKRFVKLRNPWGDTEWTGRWSDGSKEWTAEWLTRLPELDHSFGNDGQFLMECELLGSSYSALYHLLNQTPDSDFLRTWHVIEKTRLFDPSWVLSTQWLNATGRPYPCAWSYGDVSCAILTLLCVVT
jgi:hypothetical protein